jgi:hypothetical protein|tara:strand:- start:1990 stop:2406 length:417 start_codon:yes stop_codon:yes gene_type:complete
LNKTGRWKLPQPTDLQEDNEWIEIPRIARTVPFGYELHPEDSEVLVPIPDELDKLQQAKKYIKQYSYREVANWLSKNTGRYISHVGLKKRLDNEKTRNNKARSLRKWAEYAKKAIAKAQALEENRLNSKKKESNADAA